MVRARIMMPLVALAFCCGCPFNNTPTGNDPSALEGSWQLTFAEPGDLEGFDIVATFDSDGDLTNITAEGPEGGTASLNVTTATTDVDDSNVTISIPTDAGTTTFEGTLSEDENTIEGSLSQGLELPSGDLEVTLPGSEVTFERIAE